MKIRFISMRKYKMSLPLTYRLKNLLTFKKYWSGKIWSFRLMCEYGFDLDFRQGNLIDQLLTDKERAGFWRRVWLRLSLHHRKN